MKTSLAVVILVLSAAMALPAAAEQRHRFEAGQPTQAGVHFDGAGSRVDARFDQRGAAIRMALLQPAKGTPAQLHQPGKRKHHRQHLERKVARLDHRHDGRGRHVAQRVAFLHGKDGQRYDQRRHDCRPAGGSRHQYGGVAGHRHR